MNGLLAPRRRGVTTGLVRAALPLLLLSLSACAAHTGTHQIGVSEAPTQTGISSETPAAEQAEVSKTEPTLTAGVGGAPGAKPKLPDPEQVHGDRTIAIADELLKAAPTPPDQLGLVIVLGQRAADLYWTLAIENRGTSPVRLHSDLLLLELTLTPKAASEDTAPAPPYICNPLGKTPSSELSELQPGEAEIFSFDPRSLCPVELLTEGTTVSLAYGYTVEKQLKWERGKKVELMLEDKPPFVAEQKVSEPTPSEGDPSTGTSKSAPEELVMQHKKRLFAPPMVLDETYPLEAVGLFAENDPLAKADAAATPLPLSVTIRDIGEARTPTFQIVNVTLKNVSGAPLDVVVRRELMTFEVVGPLGATTCRMEPTQVDPLPHNFSHLEAGGSRAIATRLPEVCPAGTFTTPGQYSVFVRYRSPSAGTEFGKQGFQGEVRSGNPAHLRVPDPLRKRGPATPVRRVSASVPG
jgi:hypothetical protein